jgi:Predicted PP-loop superfamily ATPase
VKHGIAIDCIVVLSGGMDSTVLLYDILDRGRNAAALRINYGSRHNARELPWPQTRQ